MAFLDQFDAAVGLGGEPRHLRRIIAALRDRSGSKRARGHQPGGGIARPSDEREENDEENSLDGGGNAEAAKPRAIVNEQVPVAEQCRFRRQYLRHSCVPAPKLPNRADERAARMFPRLSGAPQPPLPILRNAQPLLAEAETARGWLTNSTANSAARDESTVARGESMERARSGCDSSKFNLLCSAAICT